MGNRIYVSILLLLASILLVFFFTELVFRIILPKGSYNSGSIYDPYIGYRFAPNSWVIDNKTNRKIKSRANQYGFLDIDHSVAKPDSTVRVAFFGDSYVEAQQVPIEERFNRKLNEYISNTRVEYFAFGMSGLGTVHSYLNSQKWTDVFDLDVIIYVFVENDMGDNISWIKRKPNRPYAYKIDNEPGFAIDIESMKNKKSIPHKFMEFLKNKSILLQVVQNRISLLLREGVRFGIDEKEREMKTVSKKSIPNQNDLPSTWDKSVKLYAEEVAYFILKKWSRDVWEKGKKFLVLYIPRGNDFLSTESQMKDTWKFWLMETCKTLNIPLLDPSKALLEKQQKGKSVYGDHFTPEGHVTMSKFINNWLIDNYERIKVASIK